MHAHIIREIKGKLMRIICCIIIKNSKFDIFVKDLPNDFGKYHEFTMYHQPNIAKYAKNI